MIPRRAGPTCTATRPPRSCRKLGVQRALGLPECATPPEEVYELAKRRGMDFVTITDHDTIDGVLEIADRPDVLRLRGADRLVPRRAAGRARPLLRDHARRPRVAAGARRRRRGVRRRTCTSSEIACALAHPFYAVEAPLTPRHRRRLAQLFADLGGRATARARASSTCPAAVYIETHGGTGIGGSDDHAGVDIGRTFTETPPAADAGRVPRPHPRRAAPSARGEQGSAAKWAHAAMALGDPRARARASAGRRARPARGAADGRAGDARGRRAPRRRSAPTSAPTTPARCCAPGWTRSSLDLRRARAARAAAGRRLLPRRPRPPRAPQPRAQAARARSTTALGAATPAATSRPLATALFDACVAGDPLRARRPRSSAARRRKLARARRRAARGSRWSPTASAAMHGVTHTLDEIRERGVPGFEVEVIGTDPNVDRRLSAVAEVDDPVLRGPEDRRAEPARRSSRRWPRAATTSCTSARPARPASPPR